MFVHYEEMRFNPDPHNPHVKIVSRVAPNGKVLDVGCASGYLARELKKKNCVVVGIEINREMAAVARNYCDKVIVTDIEEVVELPIPEKEFDFIILSDVLEHLRRPDLVIIKLKRYLAPDGLLIASIPNIARIEIRLKLLFGKFNYQDTGIMSKVHLRFFTLKTAKDMFKGAGYKIIQMDYTGLGSRFRILPTLFAFQFLLTARVESRV